MTVLGSRLSAHSESFRANRADMLALLDAVRAAEARIESHSDARRPVFERRGQLHPRDRVALLLDRGSPFLEFSTLVGWGLHGDDGTGEQATGGATISGMGLVCGVRCIVVAHDSGIKGGAITPMGMKKQIRAQQIAIENKLPVVYLVESAGGSMPHQADTFVEGGAMFRNQARLSAMGVPQIAVVHGSSTAGGAYLPGLSDYLIMVRGGGKVFLAGPPLLKAATGEIASDEELGGAVMHTSVSGVADVLAEDDADGIAKARELIERLHWPQAVLSGGTAPNHDPDELAGVVPVDFRKPYDVREVIARIVDGSDFAEFKQDYGAATVCGQAELMGLPVALIGNNGPIDANAAVKAAQFIQLMCQAGTAIVYLQNITGFMVGRDAERAGIVKHGAKMIQAVANATVPQITLYLGASFGAGHYGMCGRAFEPRFAFAWPSNRVAVMGGEQAARVMSTIARDRAQREGHAPDEPRLARQEQRLIEQFAHESTALFATARLWDDGIIDPRDTRRVLGFCLGACYDAELRRLHSNTFGVARL